VHRRLLLLSTATSALALRLRGLLQQGCLIDSKVYKATDVVNVAAGIGSRHPVLPSAAAAASKLSDSSRSEFKYGQGDKYKSARFSDKDNKQNSDNRGRGGTVTPQYVLHTLMHCTYDIVSLTCTVHCTHYTLYTVHTVHVPCFPVCQMLRFHLQHLFRPAQTCSSCSLILILKLSSPCTLWRTTVLHYLPTPFYTSHVTVMTRISILCIANVASHSP
jgi:hypothetical protein